MTELQTPTINSVFAPIVSSVTKAQFLALRVKVNQLTTIEPAPLPEAPTTTLDLHINNMVSYNLLPRLERNPYGINLGSVQYVNPEKSVLSAKRAIYLEEVMKESYMIDSIHVSNLNEVLSTMVEYPANRFSDYQNHGKKFVRVFMAKFYQIVGKLLTDSPRKESYSISGSKSEQESLANNGKSQGKQNRAIEGRAKYVYRVYDSGKLVYFYDSHSRSQCESAKTLAKVRKLLFAMNHHDFDLIDNVVLQSILLSQGFAESGYARITIEQSR